MGYRMADRWEYKTITLYSGVSLSDRDRELTTWGNEGWELVSIINFSNGYLATFKRPLPVEIIKTKPEPWIDHGWNGK